MFVVESHFKNANVARTIRFTEPMFEQLTRLAEENEISFNHLVLQCCKYALENLKEEQ